MASSNTVSFSITVAASASVTMGEVTFTVSGATSAGIDDTGRAYAVVPSGIATVSMTPVETVDGFGDVINGAMKNPIRTSTAIPDQAYDQRLKNYNTSLKFANGGSVTAGDIIIKTVGKTDGAGASRAGSFSDTAVLHIVSSPLAAGSVLPSSVGWAGRVVESPYSIDWDTWLQNRPIYSSVGVDFPSYEVLMSSLSKVSPTMTHVWSAFNGYEFFSTFALGGGETNYGRYIGNMLGNAMLALVSDIYTDAQTVEIAKKVVAHGLELGDPALKSSVPWTADGGHFQFIQGPLAFALYMTGRSGDIPAIMTDTPGNWSQAFKWTTALIAQTEPHDSMAQPAFARRRTLAAQPGGSVIRIPVEGTSVSGDDDETGIAAGMVVTDGITSVEVATDYRFPNNPTAGTTGDVTLVSTNPFTATDVVWFEAPGLITEGGFDWTLLSVTNRFSRFSPWAGTFYRGLQSWGGQIMSLHAMGVMDSASMEAVIEYFVKAGEANTPSATNDYQRLAQPWKATDGIAYSPAPDFFTAHWTAISAITQIGGTAPDE